MIEFQVELINGIAYVYAERYVIFDGFYQFFRGDKAVIKFDAKTVVDVQQTVAIGGARNK